MNHNVFLVWVFTLLDATSLGIYGTTILSGFLFHITNGSNLKVGLAEGLQGMCQVVMAIPAGLSTDKFGRANVLKVSGSFSLLTMILMFGVLFTSDSFVKAHMFWFITVGLMFLGAEQSFRWTGLMTIYADSIPREKRTWYFSMRRILVLIGVMSGPLFGIIMFSIAGDSWSFSELRMVFAVGLSFRCLTAIILLFFDDSKTLGRESDAIVETGMGKGVRYGYLVPYIMLTSDIVKALAAGMTVKFFPLFFKNETHLLPSQVNAIIAVTAFIQIIFTYLLGMLSNWLGKIQTVLCAALCGVSLLVMMGLLKNRWADWKVIVPIYIFRTVFMNSCSGIRKSVLMDFVRKSNRGKWNAVDSFTRFGWSGSALLGGFVIDKYGYGCTFFITAAFQFIGYAILIPLIYIISLEEGTSKEVIEPLLSLGSTDEKKLRVARNI